MIPTNVGNDSWKTLFTLLIMPALDAGILFGREEDDRVKPGHDEM
jgi:hypothetical protein